MTQRTLTTIVLSLLLIGSALSPLLLDNSFNVASESSDETGDEKIRELCSDDVKPTLDNIDHFDWIHCSGDLQAIWTALNIKEETFQQASSLSEASSVWGDVDRDAKPERILRSRRCLGVDGSAVLSKQVLRPGVPDGPQL